LSPHDSLQSNSNIDHGISSFHEIREPITRTQESLGCSSSSSSSSTQSELQWLRKALETNGIHDKELVIMCLNSFKYHAIMLPDILAEMSKEDVENLINEEKKREGHAFQRFGVRCAIMKIWKELVQERSNG